MSTQSGNTGPLETGGATGGTTGGAEAPRASGGGALRNRTERLAAAPANETQVLPLSHTPVSHTKELEAEDTAGHTDGYRQDAGGAGRAGGASGVLPGRANREALLAREREAFGGMKFGAAFFGWLSASGMVVLLSALAASVGAAVGFSSGADLGQSLDQAAASQTAGVVGAAVLLAILLLAYYAGGYVAGRMARFNGLKQGLAVWLWGLVAGAAVVVLGLVFGTDIRSITQLDTVAPLPEDLPGAGTATWIAVATTLAATLVGALLGGLAGMRYHRRIDRADFSDTDFSDTDFSGGDTRTQRP